MSTKKLLQAAAGSAGGDKVYVEDVFSNYLFTTDDSARTITNGIDLAGEGGLVWFKARNTTQSHALFDSTRGNNVVYSNKSNAQDPLLIGGGGAGSITLNNNGFSFSGGLYSGQSNINNGTTTDMVSWSFRKQKGFFDCVKFSTTGGGGQQTVSHNLGSIPGTIIIKQLTAGADGYWYVFNKSVTSPNSDWWRNYANLNITAAFGDWGSTAGIYSAPTSSGITVSTYFTNQTADFIAYFFAEGGSADQIFGAGGDEAIVKCGSYTGSGAVGKTITLGFEPQWMLVKNASTTTPWVMIDNMRGMPVNGEGPRLLADQNAGEVNGASFFAPRATGAEVTLQNTYVNTSGEDYIYMAIRRGPMKEPSAGTDFFQPIGTSGDNPNTTTATFPWDMQFNTFTNTNYATYNNQINDRLRGFGFVGSWSSTPHLTTANTDVQTVSDSFLAFKSNGMDVDKSTGWGASATTIFYNFRRYPKVFDVVCYAGAGGNADVTHNLGVAPEMMIVKATDKSEGWAVQAYPALSLVSRVGILNSTNPFSGNSQFNGAPTATVFKVGTSGNTNESGYNYVAYLFATLPNVSKIGFYDGTAATINIDCGFSSPARFVMIKRADAGAGPDNWFVFDSVRGISVGNDPWFAMNTTDAQVTTNNYISPYASGFTVNATTASGINELYGDYIFLAIA